MPHATEEGPVSEDQFLQRLQNEADFDMSQIFDEENFGQGEKADDAEDYGDISDLAEEEEEVEEEQEDEEQARPNTNDSKPVNVGNIVDELQDDHLSSQRPAAISQSNEMEVDPLHDLWFEEDATLPNTLGHLDDGTAEQKRRPSSPGSARSAESLFNDEDVEATRSSPQLVDNNDIGEENDDDDDPALREQMLLFEQAKRDHEERMRRGGDASMPPPPPETDAELFAIVWPQFEQDQVPRFGELLPSKRAYYVDKKPFKLPKPIQPSKVSLELQPDQEKTFRIAGPATSTFSSRAAAATARGVVLTQSTEITDDNDEDVNDDSESGQVEGVAGIKWQDLVMLCEDWDIPVLLEDSGRDEYGNEFERPKKKQRINYIQHDGPRASKNPSTNTNLRSTRPSVEKFACGFLKLPRHFDQWLDNPEQASSKIAKKVNLDMNDPYLLIDVLSDDLRPSRKRTFANTFARDASGGLTRELHRRYNLSNDAAYDLLKENRQSKVRAHLGEVTLEHSVPALRLQYPFYKVKLSNKEARSFHRSTITVNPGQVYFSKLSKVKQKHLKGKDSSMIFAKTKDLTLGDNSSMLLLEYSEEYPVMLSNFGMNSRLVNYYRRKDMEDTSRPKLEIGETAVLQPHDKSPFAQFGFVDPGQTVPTIRNALYRVPIFKHETPQQDFVLIRNRTAAEGTSWYLKNLENLHVVGQEFPLVEVPGTHARQVTTVAKNRLKMVSYRIFRRRKRLRNEDILKHFPGSDIAQNRSKMREFMQYDKQRGWLPKQGDDVPEEETVRAMITPDTICLLDSMQVGDRQLQDAGYNADEIDIDENGEDEREGQSLENQLAPWQITKNFLNACQSKAMLQLHGDGDPTGRGEGFSMIRTSMKGGFKELGESVASRLDAKRTKDSGGHSYNVARQNEAYNEAIRKIWDAQTQSLTSTVEHTDIDPADVPPDEVRPNSPHRDKSASAAQGRSRIDDGASTFSRASESSHMGQILKITRTVKDKHGKEQQIAEFVRDPKVIRAYVKRRRLQELDALSFGQMVVTGDAEKDKAQVGRLKAELERLERNQGRRIAREKEKKGDNTGEGESPQADGQAPRKGGQTVRKCANCGQVGHIKTNKKWCSLCIYMTTPSGNLVSSVNMR